MKYYLSSYELGNETDRLKALATKGRIGYIPNARDFTGANPERKAKRTVIRKNGPCEGELRTFYRDPRILLLDEPTSSIDAEAEAKIFEKLEALPPDRTVILISHRFSTVRKANQIVIIEDGAIKELGTHEELLKLNGTYARLFNIQAQGYK